MKIYPLGKGDLCFFVVVFLLYREKLLYALLCICNVLFFVVFVLFFISLRCVTGMSYSSFLTGHIAAS